MPLVSLHTEKYIRPAPKDSTTKKFHPYGVSSKLFSFFCLLRSYMGSFGSSMSIIHAFFLCLQLFIYSFTYLFSLMNTGNNNKTTKDLCPQKVSNKQHPEHHI